MFLIVCYITKQRLSQPPVVRWGSVVCIHYINHKIRCLCKIQNVKKEKHGWLLSLALQM